MTDTNGGGEVDRGDGGWSPSLLDLVFYRYEWVAVSVGVAGNFAFLVGSVLFLSGIALPGQVLFVAGSFGMFVASLARLYVDRRKLRWRMGDGGDAMARARREADAATVS